MLKAVVETLDDIDPKYHDLYREGNGNFILKPIEGMKTEADVVRLQTALKTSTDNLKELKSKYALLGDLDPNEIMEKLDRYPELEEASKGKIDETKLNELVEAKLKAKLAPYEREKSALTAKITELEQANNQYSAKEKQRIVHDSIRQVALDAKIAPEALEDVLLNAERVFEVDESGRPVVKDGVGFTPGIDPKVWISEIQPKRQLWWGVSQGGGASGSSRSSSGVKNPFSKENWNLTEQGQIYNSNPQQAEMLAKSAGTFIGGPRPV